MNRDQVLQKLQKRTGNIHQTGSNLYYLLLKNPEKSQKTLRKLTKTSLKEIANPYKKPRRKPVENLYATIQQTLNEEHTYAATNPPGTNHTEPILGWKTTEELYMLLTLLKEHVRLTDKQRPEEKTVLYKKRLLLQYRAEQEAKNRLKNPENPAALHTVWETLYTKTIHENAGKRNQTHYRLLNAVLEEKAEQEAARNRTNLKPDQTTDTVILVAYKEPVAVRDTFYTEKLLPIDLETCAIHTYTHHGTKIRATLSLLPEKLSPLVERQLWGESETLPYTILKTETKIINTALKLYTENMTNHFATCIDIAEHVK